MEKLLAKLVSKTKLSSRAIFLSFEINKKITYVPGQFFTFFFEKEGKKYPRSYSLVNPIINNEETNKISFGVKVLKDGVASNILLSSDIGDEFSLMGPFGGFVYNNKDTNNKICFIATDTGIIPFYSMLQSININKPTQLIFGSRNQEEIYFKNFFTKLENENELFTFSPTLTREDWNGLQGRVQNNLPKELTDTTFYVCGSKDMVLETIEKLKELGVEKKDIKFERYN